MSMPPGFESLADVFDTAPQTVEDANRMFKMTYQMLKDNLPPEIASRQMVKSSCVAAIHAINGQHVVEQMVLEPRTMEEVLEGGFTVQIMGRRVKVSIEDIGPVS